MRYVLTKECGVIADNSFDARRLDVPHPPPPKERRERERGGGGEKERLTVYFLETELTLETRF